MDDEATIHPIKIEMHPIAANGSLLNMMTTGFQQQTSLLKMGSANFEFQVFDLGIQCLSEVATDRSSDWYGGCLCDGTSHESIEPSNDRCE